LFCQGDAPGLYPPYRYLPPTHAPSRIIMLATVNRREPMI